ncbi:MAG: DsrE/DsrF/DrsH-like family protein [Pseudomonadota bacterium]|nr:DsrE/DsrF/DrsH-like family protein [Pseudomonadota bacterium]
MNIERVRIDCRGLRCPAPILEVSRAAKRHRGVPVVLEVEADDHDFPKDIESWCRSTRTEIAGDVRHEDGTYTAVLLLNGALLEAPPAAGDAAEVDLRGLAVPMALMRLGNVLSERPRVRIVADAGPLSSALFAWAAALGATVGDLQVEHGVLRAGLDLPTAPAPARPTAPAPARPVADAPRAEATPPAARASAAPEPEEALCTLLVLRNDFESLMAALMVANASAAQGMQVSIFFSFWGVNLLRGEAPRSLVGVPTTRVSPLHAMMKWMMPRGPNRQKMSKMHMGGVGTAMMRFFMREQNVLGLAELLDEAARQDVRFCVCTMSMGVMGIQKADLMDLANIEFGGVTTFTERARRSALSLVF